MSETEKKKYKVLHPANGYEEGQIVEITEAEAANINAGEATPRLEEVSEGGEQSGTGEQTPPEGEGAPESEPQNPPAPEGEPTPPAGEGEGAQGEGGADAGDQNA